MKEPKYSEVLTLKISKTQKLTLGKLKVRRVKVSEFIRIAIKEKIERDYQELKIKEPKIKCPF
jgi:hypothetical protein